VRFPVDAIYYISLPRAVQRRKKLLSHFDEIGLTDKHGNQPEMQTASDGNYISHRIDNSLKKANKRQIISLSEIGCCASHREVWQKMLDNGNELALVLEDDARFDVQKTNQLVTNWNRLPEFDFLHLGWSYYAGYGEQIIEPVDCIEGLQLWKGNQMWLTHGYIVNRKAAQLFLEHTYIQNNGLDAMTAWIQDLMLSYGFQPHVCFQDTHLTGHQRSQIHHTG
jgi:glycosyl transferase family 25